MRRFSRSGLIIGAVCAIPCLSLTMSVGPRPLLAQETPASGPLVSVPQTPEQRISAALLLLKLSRRDLAQDQLKAVVEANLDATTLLQLRDKFGTGTFLRLARVTEVVPYRLYGAELLEQISVAARSNASADAYLDDILIGLDGNREEVQASLREIKRLGADGVIALTERAGADVAQDFRIERVLTMLDDRATGPLADVALVSPREAERAIAVRVLSRTARAAQIPVLVAVAANPANGSAMRADAMTALKRLKAESLVFDAAQSLRLAAEDVLNGQEELVRDNNGVVQLYDIDASQPAAGQSLTRQEVSDPTARKILAMRLIDEAIAIDPDDRAALRMGYVLRLELAESATATNELFRRGPTAATEVLELALRLGLTKPAVAALDIIGVAGRESAFASQSPAARALDSKDPEVKFAAARAAVKLEPRRLFLNRHRVVEVLLATLNSDSSRKVVVVDPNVRRGGDIGGRLQQVGFSPIVVDTGRQGFREAAGRSDVALAVVHANSVNWELTPTLANFRADARTAAIPVAVVASTRGRDALTWIRSRNPDLIYIPVQADAAGIRQALKPALAQIDEADTLASVEKRREAAVLVRRIAERRLTETFPLGAGVNTLLGAAYDSDETVAVNVVAALGDIPRNGIAPGLAEIVAATTSESVRREALSSLVRSLSRYNGRLSEKAVDALAGVEVGGDLEMARLLSAAIGLSKK